MIDPDKERGDAKPHQNPAKGNNSAYYKRFRQFGGRIWHILRWPRRWWLSGEHNRRTANATVLLAVGTLMLAGVNFGMLLEMRQGGDQQHRDTLSALGKTDASITVLREQTAITRGQLDAMRTTERAFVVGNNVIGGHSDSAWHIAPVLENTGNTATQYLSAKVNYCMNNNGLPKDFGFPDLGKVEVVPLVLAPKSQQAMASSKSPTE